MNGELDNLTDEIRGCRVCAADLPFAPRPVVVLRPTASVLIIGQAPGTKVQESGVPWNDASGQRLRHWLGLDPETFYNHPGLGIMPMGFCYPGKIPKGGDAPPRKECAPLWHERCLAAMSNIKLTLLVGSCAQKYYLRERAKRTLHETVLDWRNYLDGHSDGYPAYLPTPHPSWRVTGWMAKNPWFEADLVPELQARMRGLLQI